MVKLLESRPGPQYFASLEWQNIRGDFNEDTVGGILGRLPSAVVDEDEDDTEEMCERDMAIRRKHNAQESSSRGAGEPRSIDIDGLPLLGDSPTRRSGSPESAMSCSKQTEETLPR